VVNYGDLLSAESLLFAVLGMLLSVWYPEIVAAINIEIPKLSQDVKAGDKASVKSVMRIKILPITILGGVIFLVFLPNAVQVVVDALEHASHLGTRSWGDYDAVKLALVVVTAFGGLFTVYGFLLLRQINGVSRTQRSGKG
jgi:hypothetical protein